jgi:DNA-binding GntR family transcriptional regulator
MTWSEFIKNDLKLKICSQNDLLPKMTLHTLSKHYEVSPTPVRIAVHELIRDGYLKKESNGRLRINQEKFGLNPGAQPERPKNYYEEITQDLIARSFKEEAVFVREEETATRYGICSAAVRQVFNRLAGMGLLEHLPRRGWRLKPFRRSDLEGYLEVREVLELKALDLAWPKLDDRELQAIHDRNTLPEDPGEEPHIDNSLHTYLIQLADNRYINDFFERYGQYYDLLYEWDSVNHPIAVKAVKQHRAILAALLRRDRPAAKRLLVKHIRYNYGFLKVPRPASDDRIAKVYRFGL